LQSAYSRARVLLQLMRVCSPVGAGLDPGAPPLSPPPAGLRGRVEQQVDALTGTAQKALTGVVGSSFGVLRALLPGGPETPAASAEAGAAPWNAMRPAFGLLRRESGFAIASLAASLPGRPAPPRAEDGGRQMTEVVSRPGSRASSLYAPLEEESESASESEEGSAPEDALGGDAHSVRSFESMLSSRRKAVSRKSLADRLARVSGVRAGALDAGRVRFFSSHTCVPR
jgi:hypothetical protein